MNANWDHNYCNRTALEGISLAKVHHRKGGRGLGGMASTPSPQPPAQQPHSSTGLSLIDDVDEGVGFEPMDDHPMASHMEPQPNNAQTRKVGNRRQRHRKGMASEKNFHMDIDQKDLTLASQPPVPTNDSSSNEEDEIDETQVLRYLKKHLNPSAYQTVEYWLKSEGSSTKTNGAIKVQHTAQSNIALNASPIPKTISTNPPSTAAGSQQQPQVVLMYLVPPNQQNPQQQLTPRATALTPQMLNTKTSPIQLSGLSGLSLIPPASCPIGTTLVN